MSDLQLENMGCPDVAFEVVIFADVTPFCTTTPSGCTLITPPFGLWVQSANPFSKSELQMIEFVGRGLIDSKDKTKFNK